MTDFKYIIKCENVFRVFKEGPSELAILSGIDFSVRSGEQLAIMGRSGSGKTTLLQILGGLDKPTSGRVYVDDMILNQLTENELSLFRNKKLGFVYQFHHLLPEFSALENVMMPLLISDSSHMVAKQKAYAMLERVGLSERLHHKPAELSGGEKQRVAIARALVHHPSCVFADEPTGNLDNENAEQIFTILKELNRDMGTTFIIVTHDPLLARKMDRILILDQGNLHESSNAEQAIK